MKQVIVSGSFDNLRSRHVRFLEEAARLGLVHVLFWSDRLVEALTGQKPKFLQAERQYFLESIRYVQQVSLVEERHSANSLPLAMVEPPATWAVPAEMASPEKASFCQRSGIDYRVIPDNLLQEFPMQPLDTQPRPGGWKKVVVTGCFDWLHTGHVRFFEETAQLGDLYVVVGSDANVRLLKGAGHPLFREAERLYMVQSIRFVTEARVSTGTGWMDAEPEIEQIHPDCYVVNEDGDQPEKREFCRARGIEYVVLKRLPKEGLPQRESTRLRGF